MFSTCGSEIRRRSLSSAHLYQPVSPLPMIAYVSDSAAQLLFRRGMLRVLLRLRSRQLQHIAVTNNVCDPQRRDARLLRPKELAGTAQLHVHLGNVEPVVRFHHGPDSFLGGLV